MKYSDNILSISDERLPRLTCKKWFWISEKLLRFILQQFVSFLKIKTKIRSGKTPLKGISDIMMLRIFKLKNLYTQNNDFDDTLKNHTLINY